MMRILHMLVRLIWGSGALLACLLIALIIMAMAELGLTALVWTATDPTDNYVTNRWLSMMFPATVGLVVGVTVAWRNWRVHRSQMLNGWDNFGRSIAASLAAYIEVSMGIAAIKLLVESSVLSAKESVPDGLTPAVIQPYFLVSLVESLLLVGGVYAVVEITRRACFMNRPSVRTARGKLVDELLRSVVNLKRVYAGTTIETERRQMTPHERAQRRMREACPWNKWSPEQLPYLNGPCGD